MKITKNLFPRIFYIKFRLLAFVLLFSLSFTNTAYSWVYSEHRDIAIQAVKNLNADYRTDFDSLWQSSRSGFEKKLCKNAADSAQGLDTDCIDWAAFSAIAGDHSCSSTELLDSILNENWLIKIANISAQLKAELDVFNNQKIDNKQQKLPDSSNSNSEKLRKKKIRSKRLNSLRTADTKLLSADPQYATRANSNTAHFLIPRPASKKTTGPEYAELTLRPGSKINAIGVYSWYHISALKKASRLANEPQLTLKQRQIITRSMLADEGFALHFLQDVFAAGHVAGTWGEVSQRLGTHNYYNQHGIEVYTWNRKLLPVVLMGDAHMRPQDMQLAAKTINISLKQVIDFAMARATGYDNSITQLSSAESDDFNVCTQNDFTQLNTNNKYDTPLGEVLVNTPIPGLGDGAGSLPRFRSEVGFFLGLSGFIDSRAIDGGFLDFQQKKGIVTGLDLSFRVGFGMDGIMNDSGDGLVFASIGFRTDSASSNKFTESSELAERGSISAAIPARSGVTLRFRLPFYIIPTDLIWMSPLYLFNKTAYANMAVKAGNGGLIPWQQGIATSIGRFQFVLGREFGLTFYGWDDADELIIPADSTGSLSLVKFKSILVDIPIVEYRPYRSFSSNQSSSMIVQLFTSADIPQSHDPIAINGVSKSLDTVWSIGIRLVFDWRHY